MKHLHLYEPVDIDELAWPKDTHEYTLQSPARWFITDFKHIKPLVVESKTSVDTVKSLMQSSHTNMISVMDSHEHFLGVISLDDLSDQKIMRKLAEGFRRSEVCVTDMMVKRRDLLAFDAAEIESASIAEVISALKQHREKYGLVLDRHEHAIRGIFSIYEISRRLGRPIEIQEAADFYRVFAPVACANR